MAPSSDRRAPATAPPDPDLATALAAARACTVCAEHLPLGPRPVVQAGAGARIAVVGQAPGMRVHATGLPFNDPSGDRLRAWLGVDRAAFYDPERLAIIPMGFCYPGTDPRGGDRPPRPECAPLRHARLRAHLPRLELTLLVGAYAQAFYLGPRRAGTLTETVRAWRSHLPDVLPTPHPSWRNTAWLMRHPWFEAEVVPELQRRVAALIG